MFRTRYLTILPALCFPIAASWVTAGNVDVWFGTATSTDGDSRGIYHSSFDTDTGKLSRPQLAAECMDPGFLALHPDGKTLYATGRPRSSEGPRDAVSAFRLNGETGHKQLEFISEIGTGDGGAAHVSTDRAGKVLLSAQYGGGSTSLYELAEDGKIARLAEVKEHKELMPKVGSGVAAGRQDESHSHWTGTSPDDRFVFVPDLGMDRVVIWELDPEKPSLTHHGYGVCPPGSGPRHMRFSPDGTKIYVLNELSLTITVFAYNAEKGEMTPVQTIPTLSEEAKAKETSNSASEICVSADGKFVYAANRGHDSISVFRVGDEGQLAAVEVVAIHGGWPRNFNIDPTGRWLIAAGQDSNTATVFAIDAESGELTFIRETQPVPSPICVLFSE